MALAQVKVDGIHLEYEWHGDRRKPVILGIVGFSDQLTAWPTPLVDAVIGSGHSVLIFDSRDMGLSTHFDAAGYPDVASVLKGEASYDLPYTLHDMAADSVALLDRLEIRSAHVMGYSMGGAIAQIAAIQRPDLFKSMTLIFSTSYSPDLPKREEHVREKMLRCCAPHIKKEMWVVAMYALLKAIEGRHHGFGKHRRAIVQECADRAFNPAGTARHVLAIAEYSKHPLLADLARISIPALIVQSDDDPLFNLRHGQDLHERLCHSTLMVVQGGGHVLCDSVAVSICEAVTAHIKSAEKDATGKGTRNQC